MIRPLVSDDQLVKFPYALGACDGACSRKNNSIATLRASEPVAFEKPIKAKRLWAGSCLSLWRNKTAICDSARFKRASTTALAPLASTFASRSCSCVVSCKALFVSSTARSALASTSAMCSRIGASSVRISCTVSSFATGTSSFTAIMSRIPKITLMRSAFEGSLVGRSTFFFSLSRISVTRAFAARMSGDKLDWAIEWRTGVATEAYIGRFGPTGKARGPAAISRRGLRLSDTRSFAAKATAANESDITFARIFSIIATFDPVGATPTYLQKAFNSSDLTFSSSSLDRSSELLSLTRSTKDVMAIRKLRAKSAKSAKREYTQVKRPGVAQGTDGAQSGFFFFLQHRFEPVQQLLALVQSDNLTC